MGVGGSIALVMQVANSFGTRLHCGSLLCLVWTGGAWPLVSLQFLGSFLPNQLCWDRETPKMETLRED